MIYINIILLKTIRYFAVLIGNIIRFFRGNKNIDLKNIKKIIFNRKDRIGDAVISKPFIILFSKYVKEELKLDIDIEVECSKYNEFVFTEGDGEKYYKIISSDEKISNVGINTISLLKQQVKNLFLKRKNNKKIDCVFIDLIGNPDHIITKNDKNYYFIGSNLFFNNFLLDYSLPENYVSGVKTNLVQSYINLVSGCFKLDEFNNYVNKYIEDFYPDYNYSKNKSGILVLVGNKEYRNLNTSSWIKIIKDLSKKHKEKKIIVMDDNTNIIYHKLKNEKFNKNVDIKENKFSLVEFKNYAKNFELLIGIDGGGFNYIRTCTNSITIYTIGNHYVRSIFIGKNNYKKSKLGNNRIINECNIKGKNYMYIYKQSSILPTYDHYINSNYFNDIHINNRR